MKSLLALFVMAFVGANLSACGSDMSKNSSSRSSATTPTRQTVAKNTRAPTPQEYMKVDQDQDNDTGAGTHDDANNDETLNYGHAANPVDTQAITVLIKRYYAAAAAGDGAKACAMLYITLAESVAEDYGHESAGPSYLSQGTSCPAVMDLLFQHYHNQLAAELPILKVTRVRLIHRQGLAILNFGTWPERQISLHQQRHTWKIGTLLDSELP